MADKQIIIDCVDVSGCIFKKEYGCSAYSTGSLGCNVHPNCYYKQLKRTEKLLQEIKEIAESHKTVPCLNINGDCFNCNDKMTENGQTCVSKGRFLILEKIKEQV